MSPTSVRSQAAPTSRRRPSAGVIHPRDLFGADQFYAVNGKIELSDQRGVVQTFVASATGETGEAFDVEVPDYELQDARTFERLAAVVQRMRRRT